MTVNDIMTRKLVSVGMDDTVSTIQDLFARHKFHHILVLQHGVLFGVISDRDLLKNVSPFLGQDHSERHQDRALLNRRAHQIMTRKPVTVAESSAVETAARIMLESNVSCLPVVTAEGKPIGVVTSHDLLRSLLAHTLADAPE